jgi:hypothetical protein
MVLLRTVPSSFHARVLAARLGADGIPTHLRGAVDGPYPMGDVMVYVGSDDLAVAQDLLLADEVEAAFDLPEEGEPWEHRRRRPLLLGLTGTQLLALVGIVLIFFSGVLARVLG